MIEHIISIIAPHHCISCGSEDNRLVCKDCSAALPWPPPSCYRCGKPSHQGATCKVCGDSTWLTAVYARTYYSGVAKDLLWKLKFGRAKSAAHEIAQLLPSESLADAQNVLIVPLPTSTARVRHRGYDQAVLIAKAFAKIHGLPCLPVLARLGQRRQVGSGRAQRLMQTRGAYYMTKPASVKNKVVVIVDDVITTGSSLEAAAELLRAEGARCVTAITFASAVPQKDSEG